MVGLAMVVVVGVVGLVCLWRVRRLRRCGGGREEGLTVGFLHPSCGGGGGGERVLWVGVDGVLKGRGGEGGKVGRVVVFGSGDGDRMRLMEKVREQFGLEVEGRVEVVELWTGSWTDSRYFPVGTLMLQALVGGLVTAEALWRRRVDVLVETSAHSFAPVVGKCLGIKVMSYIHYPTISSEMVRTVAERRVDVNNSARMSSSFLASRLKLLYYRCFAQLYRLAAVMTDVVVANSTWTRTHLEDIFGRAVIVRTVFPPCDVNRYRALSADRRRKRGLIISLAQFRPEKNHELQLRTLARLRSEYGVDAQLMLVGGVRNRGDEARVRHLEALAEDLGVGKSCTFVVNADNRDVYRLLADADVAIHTMKEEHFGISVVELMAAALVVVAHNSGGVQSDIIRHRVNGLLAEDVDSYAASLHYAMSLSDEKRKEMEAAARDSVMRFSDDEFRTNFLAAMDPLLSSSHTRRHNKAHE